MKSANSTKTTRSKPRKIKLKKETVRDLELTDDKMKKLKGGGKRNTIHWCCDRNLKENFAPVNAPDILTRLSELTIQKWNYKTDHPSVAHLGPMAQDFAAAFGVGEDDKHISAVDAAGVAFAAIQALLQMIRQRDGELNLLRSELDALRERTTVTH